MLESRGYRVGIISQPDWKNKESITVFGEPRLAFLVSAGNMDSMVNHYSVSKKRRATDAYTPGGVMGKRPDYAAVVYGNLIRQTYKQTPVILGGIEQVFGDLRIMTTGRSDKTVDPLGFRCRYHFLRDGRTFDRRDRGGAGCGDRGGRSHLSDGTVVKVKSLDSVYDAVELPSFEQVKEQKETYARSFYTQYQNTDPFRGQRLVEPYSPHLYVVQNPPAKPLSTMEMDDIYALPYMRTWHPSYEKDGGVPAVEEIKFSLTSNRGCFGGCSFCALTFHQGRIVQTRSHESLVEEAEAFTKDPAFKGYIHDVGGPTANFRHPSCEKQLKSGVCKNRQCLFPKPCSNLNADHSDYVKLLRRLRSIPKVKKVFIRSGIRF